MKTVFIKGLGLIGSSLARAIKQEHFDYRIIASDPDSNSIEFALKNNIIDSSVKGFEKVEEADFIILASPVSQIIQDIKALANLKLKQDVIVTDVGSTKVTIMKEAKKLTKKGICFIGGHPMSGSHKTGAAAGQIDLFKGAYYFLIPAVNKQRISELEYLLKGIQAKWLLVNSRQHDQLVTQISDLPHVMAAALVNNAQNVLQNDPIGLKAAAGGFKSTTRIAASSPQMWSSIMVDNKTLIAEQLQVYIEYLGKIEKLIEDGDQDSLYEFFDHARDVRSKLD